MDSCALQDLRGESDHAASSASGDDALIGMLVADRYRVVKKLRAGAQASVYVAKHTLIKRLVALKVLSLAIAADREVVRRFLDEGRVAGTMGHPNIVESLDMGVVEDGRPFLVLEYLEGSTVADELHRRGALDVGRAAYIGSQIASALGAAHARGIVHRDLKPENVFLIDRDGRGDHVKVLDFGISKLEIRKGGSARASHVVGTPDYMAPEQVTDPAGVDARADVFALGAMLYQMLSGRLPLDVAGHEDVLEAVVRRTPAPLGRICPRLPPQILATVERAMHKDRARRTQTVAEVRAALELFAVASAPSTALLAAERPSLSALATTNESPMMSDLDSDVAAAVSTSSLLASEVTASAISAAANADRLSAQLAAIATAGPPAPRRSAAIPLLAGAIGACAAGVIVFLALRGPAPNGGTSAGARIERPTGATRIEGTTLPSATGAAVKGAVTSTSQAGSVAGASTSERTASPSTNTPPRATKAYGKAQEAAGAAALADARRERDKMEALANAAAEISGPCGRHG